jgi:adenylate cyclase
MLSKKWSHKRRRRLLHGAVLLAVGSLLTLVLNAIRPFNTISLWASDQLLESGGDPSPNIVVAGIDNSSLDIHGRWAEWPRSLHARAIDNLVAAGATVVGFDVVFADDSPQDGELVLALQRAGNVVLSGAGTNAVASSDTVATFDSFLMPCEPLTEAGCSIGHVNVVSDPDGKVRRVPLFIRKQDGTELPSLSIAVLHSLFRMPLPEKYSPQKGHMNLLARRIPVDVSGSMRLNFSATEGEIASISYADVIEGDFDQSLVRGKIVLVGITATGDTDVWQVPVSDSKVHGVYVHAAAVDTILRQRYVTEARTGITVLTMLLLCGICVLLLPRCGTWYWTDLLKGTGVVGGLLAVYTLSGVVAAGRGIIPNLLYPSLLLVGIYVSNVLYTVVREQSDKKFVKALFGRYVSPQVSKNLVNMATEGKLSLGGEEREVTVLFADIRNFTQISERKSPQAVVKMINSYLPVIIDAVARNHGMVNKFAGDSIMAVWNAPQDQPAHASLAARAAWEAQTVMSTMAADDSEAVPVRFGIGINTGIVLAGNVGTTGRSEYTVIGDAVNLASRICSSTPGGEVWIGEETYKQAEAVLDVDPLEPQTFKGKAQPVAVFRLKEFRGLAAVEGLSREP